MSLWVGISPLIGAGSLEGFAVGATVSGAFFLAITAPRRLRRRRAAVAGPCGVPACGVPASARSAAPGALGAESCHVEAFGAGAGAAAGQAGQVGQVGQPEPGAYRSRHRLTFRSSRRPAARRLPRHAAPAVSFGTRVSGRVTGLFATRPLAGGAPS